MTSFRFLHCADLHLDSPLRGLEADPDAPVERIRGATREAFRGMVDYAIREKVDFLVAAGDLYDGDWRDWRTGHFLVEQVRRLTNAAIPFVAIRGNHDAASVITRQLRMPHEMARWLNDARPETCLLPNVPVAIHGQSFTDRAIPGDLTEAYPSALADRFNIGLLHTSLTGGTVHAVYAPTDLERLRAKGYQYWALGHIHQRAELHSDPWIVFPGNLQGRHINETGGKGATLVTVDDHRVSHVRHVDFDVVRWARLTVPLTGGDNEDCALNGVRAALREAVSEAEGRLLAVRVAVTGACAAHLAFVRDLGGAREKIRAEARGVADPDRLWIESVEIATSPPAVLTALRDRTDAIGRMARELDAIGADAIGPDVARYAAGLLDRAGPLREGLGPAHLAVDAAQGRPPEELLRRARDLLLAALAER